MVKEVRDGKEKSRPVLETQYVDPSADLTPVQRHAICSKQFDVQIHSLRRQLNQSTEQDREEELLAQLKNTYSARFRIDTVYQNLKVSEIERRAQKLRSELDARSEAENSWVKAMLTLAEMKADGIDTMPDDFAPSSPPISNSGSPQFYPPNPNNNSRQFTGPQARSYVEMSPLSNPQSLSNRQTSPNTGGRYQSSLDRIDARDEPTSHLLDRTRTPAHRNIPAGTFRNR